MAAPRNGPGACITPVVLIGGGSLVAPFLLRRLAAEGATGLCLHRGPHPRTPRHGRALPPGFTPQPYDPDGDGPLAPPGAAVVSLAPLWALPPLLPRLTQAGRLVALGSTSAVVKATRAHDADRRIAQALIAAEAALTAWGRGGEGPRWALLRPTLIYDGETDGSVTAAARVIARIGAFPIAAPAKGLRQPIHADDVATAIIAALEAPVCDPGGDPAMAGRAFDLPGGETLAYDAMLVRIAAALGRSVRLVPLPEPLLAAGLWAARHLLGRDPSPSLFARMREDQIFDAGPARTAFGYAPGPFRPAFPWAAPRRPRTPASQARP